MANFTVRNLPDEVHRALRVRAALHGRSTEAEIRDILEAAVRPPQRVQIGTALHALGRTVGLTEDDLRTVVQARSKKAPKPPHFD